MNFGNVGYVEIIIILLVWCVPIVAVIWFLKTLTGMAGSLREIAARLQALERAVRDVTVGGPPLDRR